MAMGPQSIQVLGPQIPVWNLGSSGVIRFGYQSLLPAPFLLSGVLRGRGSRHTRNVAAGEARKP